MPCSDFFGSIDLFDLGDLPCAQTTRSESFISKSHRRDLPSLQMLGMPCSESFSQMPDLDDRSCGHTLPSEPSSSMTSELDDYVCCPERFREEVSRSPKSLLIIDCRSQSEYSKARIRGAININLPSLMLKRLLRRSNTDISSLIHDKEAKEKFNKYFKTATTILYDECSTDLHANPSSAINLLVKRMRQDGCLASFLLGGFSTFQERYPEYCESTDRDTISVMGLCNLRISEDLPSFGGENPTTASNGTSSPLSCPVPVQVLPYLYLGNAENASDLTQLRKHGINYVLNVTTNVPNTFENEDNFKYMTIPVSDHWSQNLSSFFPKAVRFIDEARNNKRGVLVHCLAGISRSVTVTVAYLMARENMSLNQAYDHVKSCKSNISPNFTFMGQLLEFEKVLSAEKVSGDGSLTSISGKVSTTSNRSSAV